MEPAKEVAQEPAIDIEIVPAQTAQPQLEVLTENNMEKHIQVEIQHNLSF